MRAREPVNGDSCRLAELQASLSIDSLRFSASRLSKQGEKRASLTRAITTAMGIAKERALRADISSLFFLFSSFLFVSIYSGSFLSPNQFLRSNTVSLSLTRCFLSRPAFEAIFTSVSLPELSFLTLSLYH